LCINQIKQKNTYQNPGIKRIGVLLLDHQKINLHILLLRGVFLKIGTNHKGQVKYFPYTQYMNVFINPAKPLFVRVTVFWVITSCRVKYSVIYKKYSFFIVFESEKGEILDYIKK